MFGNEQVVARLELLVVGRGSETKTSGGPSFVVRLWCPCLISSTASNALPRRSVRILGDFEAPWPIQAAK
eukprot:8656963-Pyramimonas_sp.AAC.1